MINCAADASQRTVALAIWLDTFFAPLAAPNPPPPRPPAATDPRCGATIHSCCSAAASACRLLPAAQPLLPPPRQSDPAPARRTKCAAARRRGETNVPAAQFNVSSNDGDATATKQLSTRATAVRSARTRRQPMHLHDGRCFRTAAAHQESTASDPLPPAPAHAALPQTAAPTIPQSADGISIVAQYSTTNPPPPLRSDRLPPAAVRSPPPPPPPEYLASHARPKITTSGATIKPFNLPLHQPPHRRRNIGLGQFQIARLRQKFRRQFRHALRHFAKFPLPCWHRASRAQPAAIPAGSLCPSENCS